MGGGGVCRKMIKDDKGGGRGLKIQKINEKINKFINILTIFQLNLIKNRIILMSLFNFNTKNCLFLSEKLQKMVLIFYIGGRGSPPKDDKMAISKSSTEKILVARQRL